MVNKQVALIVGASRGIGRQVAIDLAKNGYAGRTLFQFEVGASDVLLSCDSSEIHERCERRKAISAKSQFPAIDH